MVRFHYNSEVGFYEFAPPVVGILNIKPKPRIALFIRHVSDFIVIKSATLTVL